MRPRTVFRDRVEAGRRLAGELIRYRGDAPIVLGLPCGGVVVAREVADALGAPLGVCVARKIGVPAQSELGMGAVAEGGEVFIDRDTVRRARVSQRQLTAAVTAKLEEVEARAATLRRGRAPVEVSGRTVIVVDDGIAMGGTARAALRALRRRQPKRLVLAVPIGSTDTLEALGPEADEIVCVEPQEELGAVGFWYGDFGAVSDDDVLALLDRPGAPPEPAGKRTAREALVRGVTLDLGKATLSGDLAVPARATGLVLFAHGSGSTRRSPRNRLVAAELRRSGVGTLLFDLLTLDEERVDAVDAHLRFDIPFLARRLRLATEWACRQPELRHLPVGYFGANTGAAAALFAAAERQDIGAVVSRGGRPDLATAVLRDVRVPTLLIVGGADEQVLALNRLALRGLGGPKRLEVVPGATHLFEEPGALERVAELAARWFTTYLGAPARTPQPALRA